MHAAVTGLWIGSRARCEQLWQRRLLKAQPEVINTLAGGERVRLRTGEASLRRAGGELPRRRPRGGLGVGLRLGGESRRASLRRGGEAGLHAFMNALCASGKQQNVLLFQWRCVQTNSCLHGRWWCAGHDGSGG